MRSARFLLVIAATFLGLACASPVEVTLDPDARQDLWASWDWLSDTGILVQTPEPERPGTETRLAHAIAAAFAERGYERDRNRADLKVGVVLTARPVVRLRRQTGAVESITAYHNGSFEIQASENRLERLYIYRLEIYVSDPRSGRLVWQARLTDETSGDELAALRQAVSVLMAEFPQRTQPGPNAIVKRAGL